jgi:isopentenyldiphosphate isomerase
LETELIKTFDENGKETGVATREEVHKKGHWHETFHCWFVSREQEKDYIFFQLRSDIKKDYPNLFDITAAGHILAHESIQAGVREVTEEVGIHVSFLDLVPLGVIKYRIEREDLIDNEIAYVFLYNFQGS